MSQGLSNNQFQSMLTSPEMALKHDDFKKIINNEDFNKDICAVVVDEAHCVSQWGGDFRTHYAALDKLRAVLPLHIPFLATSATMPEPALREVRSKLSIDAESSFFLNLGNDRPNLAMHTQEIRASDDYEALRPLLSLEEKSIVFCNSVKGTQLTCKKVREFFSKSDRRKIDYLHALRTPRARARVMRRFRQGKVKILIATEAAGMVGQYCLASSSSLMQSN